MTEIVLVLAALVIGMGWGFIITYLFMVLPTREKLKEVIEMQIAFIDEQIGRLTHIVTNLSDGHSSMISPIQIKKEE